MPHSGGTFTIGLPSSDFLTLNDAFGDYAGGAGGLTGNLTYIVEDNTTLDTTLVTRAIYFQLMNGFTFTITCADGKYHNGVWGAGVRITLTGNSDMQIQIGILSAVGFVVISNLELTGRRIDITGKDPVGQVSLGKHIIKNNLINGVDLLCARRNRLYSGYEIYNNKLFNASVIRLTESRFDAVEPVIIENNTLYSPPINSVVLQISSSGGLDWDTRSQVVLRNNVFFNNTVSSVTVGAFPVKPYAFNCAFSNNSGSTIEWRSGSSGNIDFIPDTEFESLDSASADFLRLFKGRLSSVPTVNPSKGLAPLRCRFDGEIAYSYGGNVLPSGGIPPTLSTLDLAGEPYGKWGDYPIGCYNAEIA